MDAVSRKVEYHLYKGEGLEKVNIESAERSEHNE